MPLIDHTTLPRTDDDAAVIRSAISAEIAKVTQAIVEDEAKGVAARVEARVRGEVGAIAARVFDHFSFQRNSRSLEIVVRFQKGQAE